MIQAARWNDELLGEVTLKREELTRARERYEFSKRMAKRGYRSQNELEGDRMSVTSAEIYQEVAKEKLAA